MEPQMGPALKRNLEDGKKEQSEAPSTVRAENPWKCDKQLEKIENISWPKEAKK